MMIKRLKSGKCANCSTMQNYFVVENIESTMDFSTYRALKSVNLSVCENCGYINDDLESKGGVISTVELKTPHNQEEDVLSQLENLKHYLKNVKEPLKLLRTKANIFKLEKFEFDKFLRENYTSKNQAVQEKLDECHKILVLLADEIITLAKEINNSVFAKCLAVEMLAYIGDGKSAKDMLETVDIKDDLKDYLLDCIKLGGNN